MQIGKNTCYNRKGKCQFHGDVSGAFAMAELISSDLFFIYIFVSRNYCCCLIGGVMKLGLWLHVVKIYVLLSDT